MKEVYDFSEAERGRLYEPSAVYTFPIYLEPDVDEFMSRMAEEKGKDVQTLVNEWLRANIELVKSVQ